MEPAYHNQKKQMKKLGFVVVVVLVVLSFLFYRFETNKHDSTGNRKLDEAAAKVSAETTSGAVASKGSSQSSSSVAQFFKLMNDWQQQNPIYLMHVETSVAGVLVSRVDFFRVPNDKGGYEMKAKMDLVVPNPASFILAQEGESGRLLAFFPLANKLVRLDPKKEIMTRFAMDLDATNVTFLAKLVRAAFVETNAEYRAIVLTLDPDLMGLPKTAGAIYLTLRVNPAGQLLDMYYSALGQMGQARISYPTFEPSQVKKLAAAIKVDRARVASVPFDEVLQEEIVLIRQSRTRTPIKI